MRNWSSFRFHEGTKFHDVFSFIVSIPDADNRAAAVHTIAPASLCRVSTAPPLYAVAPIFHADDDRCSCDFSNCWDWSIPSCRCYRLVPCWASCVRSVCAASIVLVRSGFCCKAHIETHRSRCCRPTDLAAEPDIIVTFFFFFHFQYFFYY